MVFQIGIFMKIGPSFVRFQEDEISFYILDHQTWNSTIIFTITWVDELSPFADMIATKYSTTTFERVWRKVSWKDIAFFRYARLLRRRKAVFRHITAATPTAAAATSATATTAVILLD